MTGIMVSGSAVPTAARILPVALSERPVLWPAHSIPLVNMVAPKRSAMNEMIRMDIFNRLGDIEKNSLIYKIVRRVTKELLYTTERGKEFWRLPPIGFYSNENSRINVIGIVVSRSDSVSVLIGKEILKIVGWVQKNDSNRTDAEGGGKYYCTDGFELREFEGLHIQLEEVELAFKAPECIIFVSRHVGETGALLTAHYTGNFGEAKFGGMPRELSRACPNLHKAIIDALRKYAPPNYEVGIECTHHGPSDVNVPSMFVEIGSSEQEWGDVEAAKSVAKAVMSIKGKGPDCEKIIVGFGGGHYIPRFERIIRETDWAIGHVVADWCLEEIERLDGEMIKNIFDKSGSNRCIVVNGNLELEKAIKDAGYEIVGEKWVRETSGLGLEMVSLMETSISTIEDGLRFGMVRSGQMKIRELDESFLRDIQAINSKRVREVIVKNTIAFETVENGSRVSGKVAIEDQQAYENIVGEFCHILEEKYDLVVREEKEIIVREQIFSPEKARKMGVEEGPKFGELASGKSVGMGNWILMPEEVQEEKIRVYKLS